MRAAWNLAHGGSLEGYSYFQMSPNNLNMFILLSPVYRGCCHAGRRHRFWLARC